jgi:hypothetical protein
MSLIRGRLILTLALLVTPGLCWAQRPSPSRAAILAAERDRQREVRLSLQQTRLIGRLTDVTEDRATVAESSGTRAIDLGAIDTIWVRRTAVGKGALIGGAIGAVGLGVFLGLLGDALCESTNCGNETLGAALIGVGLGAAGGGLIGAGIGLAIPVWKRRFP